LRNPETNKKWSIGAVDNFFLVKFDKPRIILPPRFLLPTVKVIKQSENKFFSIQESNHSLTGTRPVGLPYH
jgi:hypothetical protein